MLGESADKLRAVWSATIRERILLSLQYRDFRTLWIANACAGAAAWALIVARGALVYEITDSLSWVGVVTFTAMIPRVFATPIIGFVADRYDRQTILSWTYGLNLGHNVVLASLVTAGQAELWNLVVLSLVNGTLRSVQQTTTQSLVPNLVPQEHLLNAVALNQATQQGSRFYGPLAAAPLLAWLGFAEAFWLCSAFYAIGLTQVFRVSTRSRGKIDRNRSFGHNLIAGFIYAYQHPMLLAMVLMAVAHCSLTMSYESMLPAISQDKLETGAAGFAYLISGVGFGALASSVFLAGIRDDATRGRVFLLFGLTSGLGPIALALSTSWELSIAATVFMGANQGGFMTITHSIIQSIVPDEIRGRISSVYAMHVGGTMALANLTNGGLSDVFNAPLVLAAGGILFIVAVSASLAVGPIRRIYFPSVAL